VPSLAFLARGLNLGEIGDDPADNVVYEVFDFLTLPVAPIATQPPNILIRDLDAEFAGADRVKFRICAFSAE
jgi:hypothetical protein